jgi:hypothetical protein
MGRTKSKKKLTMRGLNNISTSKYAVNTDDQPGTSTANLVQQYTALNEVIWLISDGAVPWRPRLTTAEPAFATSSVASSVSVKTKQKHEY